MATTYYTLQQRISNSGEWVTTDFRKGKKGTVVAEAEKRHAQDRFAVQVVTDAGTVVFELRSKKRNVTKHTKPFTVTVPPVFNSLPDELEGYEYAYRRADRGWTVLRNMEVDREERYAVVDDALKTFEFFDTTRAAGRFMTDHNALNA